MSTDDMAARFASDIAASTGTRPDGTTWTIRRHEMTVLHDEGLYRHLRFRSPDCGFYWFDLATWPGSLTVNGDCGTYTFSRVEDMFEFFRGHRVNPQHWAEKVQGETRTKTYSEPKFRELVFDDAAQAIRGGYAPKGLARAIRRDIFESEDTYYEEGARQALADFEHGEAFCVRCSCKQGTTEASDILAAMWRRHHSAENPRGTHDMTTTTVPGFRFDNAWERDLTDWDWPFLWCLHAIVWGIAAYDAERAAVTP